MECELRCWMPQIECRLCELAAKQLGWNRCEVFPSSRLFEDLHFDSLELIEFLMEIEDEFSVTIPSNSPNPIFKAVFTRRPFRISDLAEIVYLQQGTGKPVRAGSRDVVVSPKILDSSVPFTQLNGRWQNRLSLEQSPLYEPLCIQDPVRQFRRRSDGMRCSLIPSAVVEIGSDDAEALADERPVHTVHLDSFLMDTEPVSTTAYCRFLNSISCTKQNLMDWFLLDAKDQRQEHMPIKANKSGWQPVRGLDRLPMVLVSWYGANAYSLWANGRDWTSYQSEDGFLPTEAQWEYAARGAFSQPFPWVGTVNSPGGMNCAQHERGCTYQVETIPMVAVNKCCGMSPFGLHHMAGNVWQWCHDWYDDAFYERASAIEMNPVNRIPSGNRSERGGSWVGPASLCRSSNRRGRAPYARGRCLGFRCVGLPQDSYDP